MFLREFNIIIIIIIINYEEIVCLTHVEQKNVAASGAQTERVVRLFGVDLNQPGFNHCTATKYYHIRQKQSNNCCCR